MLEPWQLFWQRLAPTLLAGSKDRRFWFAEIGLAEEGGLPQLSSPEARTEKPKLLWLFNGLEAKIFDLGLAEAGLLEAGIVLSIWPCQKKSERLWTVGPNLSALFWLNLAFLKVKLDWNDGKWLKLGALLVLVLLENFFFFVGRYRDIYIQWCYRAVTMGSNYSWQTENDLCQWMAYLIICMLGSETKYWDAPTMY